MKKNICSMDGMGKRAVAEMSEPVSGKKKPSGSSS